MLQRLNDWLPIVRTIVVILLAIALVIFLFVIIVGGATPVWIQAVLLAAVVVLLTLVAISVFVPPFDPTNPNTADPVPIRIGVVLLGVIVLACVAGLIQVINGPPQVVESAPPPQADQGTTPPQGGQTTGQGEPTTPLGTETTAPPVTGSVANTANLGLSGQIVGIFGTIAAAAVGGIAGLLTQRR